MNTSFWTGAVGADSHERQLAVTSNNLANINTYGYKPKEAVFSELLQYNLNDSEEARTKLQAGDSMIVSQTKTDFHTSGFTITDSKTDYALAQDNVFFMLRDPASGDITYTRNGHFHAADMGGQFYLMTESGKYVCDTEQQPILADTVEDIEEIANRMAKSSFDASGKVAEKSEDEETTEETETETDTTDEDGVRQPTQLELDGAGIDVVKPEIGVFTLSHPSRLMNIGDNEYKIREDDTQNNVSLVEDPIVQTGAVESSGTDLAREMTRVIEAQRAFSYALKVVQTSDEIEGTINQLRG